MLTVCQLLKNIRLEIMCRYSIILVSKYMKMTEVRRFLKASIITGKHLQVWKERPERVPPTVTSWTESKNTFPCFKHSLIDKRLLTSAELETNPKTRIPRLSTLTPTSLSLPHHSASFNAESTWKRCWGAATIFNLLSYLSARSVSSWSLSA